jgi:hypothetical protein
MSKELRKAIFENPTLEIKFMLATGLDDSYTHTLSQSISIQIIKMVTYNEEVITDVDELAERIGYDREVSEDEADMDAEKMFIEADEAIVVWLD